LSGAALKRCRLCEEEKPATDKYFHKHNSTKDRLRHVCKPCRKKETYSIDYHYKNREAVLARMKVYAQRPLPRARKFVRDYTRIDIKKGQTCDLTVEFMLEVFKQACVYCGDTDQIGCDRIDNDSGHTKYNVVPCCRVCNIARSDNFTHEEMKTIGAAIAEVKSRRKQL